jgi:hypothetical protein
MTTDVFPPRLLFRFAELLTLAAIELLHTWVARILIDIRVLDNRLVLYNTTQRQVLRREFDKQAHREVRYIKFRKGDTFPPRIYLLLSRIGLCNLSSI